MRSPQVNLRRLVTGRSRYVADLDLPGMLHAVVVRSEVPHGVVDHVAIEEALACEGVVDVIAPKAASEALRASVALWRSPGLKGTTHQIGDPHLTYVGQPVALVVATDHASALDAAEAVDVEVRELPAVLDPARALDEGVPLVHEAWESNLAGQLSSGDSAESCAEAFATAPIVVEQTSRFPPVVPHPMETRGVVADWDPRTERLTVWLSTQAPHDARDQLAAVLGLGVGQVDVVVPDVGGAFGAKVHVYDDEVLVCLAALRTGRPVRWVEGRREHALATDRGRDSIHRSRLALDESGRFLALETHVTGNLGAHASSAGIGPFFVSVSMLQGPYRFERVGGRVDAVVTNTTPTGSYRGFGNTEATFVRERLVDRAAVLLGRDPVELRLQNLVTAEEMPFQTRGHARYDSGDYPAAMARVRELAADWRPPTDGRRHGVGFGFGVEYTGLGPARDLAWINFAVSGHETARVEMHPDGTVSVWSALVDMGQGLATSLAQIAAAELGVAVADVRVTLGDTRSTPYSSAGSMTSRSITVGGPAVQAASRELRDKLLAVAGHRLEVDPGTLVLQGDAVGRHDGAGDGLPLADLAHDLWLGWRLPEGMPAGLTAVATYAPQGIAFSYAAHAAAVAVDEETGEVEVEAYWVAHDCGHVVNETIVEGQIHGAVAQGIGNALFEQVRYDESGAPVSGLTGSDLPRAREIPMFAVDHLAHPSPITPGGMKGVGEGGTIVAVATVANAVAAAVPEVTHDVTSVPLTPGHVWSLLHP